MSSVLNVRRVLSETPLAVQHVAMLGRAPRRPRREIPWTRFDRAAYPEAALALAADQAQKLAEGEYGAVGLFGQIASGLALTRAPFDIISAAAMIAGDEIRHADYCMQFAELCAGAVIELRVDPSAVLDACRDLHQEEEVDFFLLKYSAIGETLAAALLTECRRGARDAVARAVYTALSSDEVHHARLGWYYFAWRRTHWSAAERERLTDRIAQFVATLEREFWIGRDPPRASADAARALGVLDSARQRETICDVMEAEIVPGLDALGLAGSSLWAARERCAARSFPDAGPTVSSAHEPPEVAWPASVATASAVAAKLAADWLERAVADDGSVRFSIDPLSREETATGPMHDGRSAVVLAALRRQGRIATADRIQGRLLENIHDALAKNAREGQGAQFAGTLALLRLAGCDVRAELQVVARETSFEGAAWHAAQVVTALGEDAPAGLFELCIGDLRRAPWAPWTARAASARGDSRVRALCVRQLVISLNRLDARGCSAEIPAPPIARVAATVEALAGEDSDEVLQALEAACAYLMRWQFRERPPPGLDPLLCCGAFPLSPDDWRLRTDVTAHAALALAGD